MTKRDVWFVVNNSFLEEVRRKLQALYNRLKGSYKKPPASAIRVMRAFEKHHPVESSTQKEFFKMYYRTNLLTPHSTDTDKSLLFGFLRTVFIGILRESPRTNVFSRRVTKYKATHELSMSLEDMLSLYRRRIGFTKRELPRDVYLDSGMKSKCKDLPEHACLPPRCTYVRLSRKGSMIEYCARRSTRRRKRRSRRHTRKCK